ncbi:MAG: CRTAC1 family protein [Elusimicrobia bacterium]|nr:CRTAC1 family protein [Elusimicrobiota bacterium]
MNKASAARSAAFQVARICFTGLVLFLVFIPLFRKPSLYRRYDGVLDETQRVRLTEVSRQSGIHFRHEVDIDGYLKSRDLTRLGKWFESISASVSVVDINRDGWPDIFFPSPARGAKSRLYVNNKDGTFSEKAADYNIADLDSPTRAVFFDCDNSGKPAMLVFNRSSTILYTMDRRGKYGIHELLDTGVGEFTGGVNILDINKDGLLDILVASSGLEDLPDSMVNSDGGSPVQAFRNIGHCRFVKDDELLAESRPTHTHALGVGDLRGQGRQDLWVASDFGNDRVFFDEGEKFEDKPSVIGRTLSNTGMTAEIAHLDAFANPVVFVGHAYQPGYFVGGNALWTYDHGKFVDVARPLGVDRCGWAWGAKFADLNNDGLLDLVVANGFISQTTGTPHGYWFKFATLVSGPKFLSGRPNVWPPFLDNTRFTGPQRDCVFINTGRGFVDVARDIGFDPYAHEGRGVAVIDFMNDGRLGMVVANQNQEPDLYRNDTPRRGSWIGLRLIGTKSNRDAIGAAVSAVLDDGRILKRDNYPFNGYAAQSDSRIHFGLGTHRVDKIRIRWPSGLEETLDAPAPGKYYTVVEGRGFQDKTR